MPRRATSPRTRAADARPPLPLDQKLADNRFRLTVQVVLSGRRWRAELDDKLRCIGTSAARMETLATIGLSPLLKAQVEIADRLGIEKGTLTRMLDTLESEELVERLPDPGDRRAKLIRLTAKGEETLEAARVVAGDLRSQLLKGFSDDEIEQMNGLLERMLSRFHEGLEAEPQQPDVQ